MPNETPETDLGALTDSLSPEELSQHPDLAPVYRAAGSIAVSSYNGHIKTSPVEGLSVENEELVHRLLRRYRDNRGFIRFPLLHPVSHHVTEMVISGDAADEYRLVQGKHPGSDEDTAYFTSFPDLSKR